VDIPFSISEPRFLLLLLSLPLVVVLGILSARARPRDRGRINASTVIRSLILLLITLALAGLQWVSSGGPLNVVFLVDESASVPQQSSDAAREYVRKAIESMGPEDRAGVVLFGERAIVDRALSSDAEWQPVGKHPAGLATNIADAIQVGNALFPEGGSRRIILLSDGAETIGKARDLAARAGLTGVQLSVVPLGAQSQNEVAVDRLASPNTVPAGQQFNVRVLLKSTSARAASVSLFDGADPAGRQDVQLQPGDNVVEFSMKASGEGFHVIKARVESVDDRYVENNEESSFTIVRKAPTVLVVTRDQADAGPFVEALKASNIIAEVTLPEAMPHRQENLARYDAIVLANASADGVGVEGQLALQNYVRTMGRGLIMLGGEVSYGAGGYLRSPLEEVLPVSMDVRTSEQRASLAMTFVLDKSGSMGRCHCGGAQKFDPAMRTEFGLNKVQLAADAIIKAAALLNSGDQFGVVGFDDAPHWLINLQTRGNISDAVMQETLKGVVAEGGTGLQAGMQAGVDALHASNAQLKHMIVIGDGWSQRSDYSQVLEQMKAQNITLSTVGAGDGPGELLKLLADQGGGNYYLAQDVRTLPDIILKETVRLIGAYYVEEPFKPLVTRGSPILNGLDANRLPQLLGYNGTTAKPDADVLLQSPRGDPVLATWQYGLGRSVAWTPDAKGRWATDWVQWPQFSQFVGQMVGWTLPQDTTPGLETAFTLLPGSLPAQQDAAVRIDSRDSQGAPRNFLSTSVVISTTGEVRPKETIFQQAPGVYGGVVKGLKQGVYAVDVEQTDPVSGDVVTKQKTGLVVPYASEYRLSDDAVRDARALLTDLAQLGGGKQLDIAQPSAAFSHDIASQPLSLPLWPWLLAAAIFLFPFDVAVRRLTVTRADLSRMFGIRDRQA
jgi:uncharacterized membrane protein